MGSPQQGLAQATTQSGQGPPVGRGHQIAIRSWKGHSAPDIYGTPHPTNRGNSTATTQRKTTMATFSQNGTTTLLDSMSTDGPSTMLITSTISHTETPTTTD